MIRLFFQILGIIFLLLIIQYVRAYLTTKDGECKNLGISYFPLNTIRICKGEKLLNNTTSTI